MVIPPPGEYASGDAGEYCGVEAASGGVLIQNPWVGAGIHDGGGIDDGGGTE